jgi:multiple sugar transport system substrate-binding protein
MILTSGYQYQLDFGIGKIGMLIDASAGYTYDKGSVGGKFPMLGAPDPIGTSGHSSQEINGASLVLFNVGTPAQQQAAWTLIKWLSSPQVNAYWDEHTNYLPLGPAVYARMKEFYAKHPTQAASFSNPEQWWYKPRSPNYPAARNAMQAIFEQALRGQISVSRALEEMTRVGTQYLSGQIRG